MEDTENDGVCDESDNGEETKISECEGEVL